MEVEVLKQEKRESDIEIGEGSVAVSGCYLVSDWNCVIKVQVKLLFYYIM